MTQMMNLELDSTQNQVWSLKEENNPYGRMLPIQEAFNKCKSMRVLMPAKQEATLLKLESRSSLGTRKII